MYDFGIAQEQKYDSLFDIKSVRSCVMDTSWKRIKGAWAVLTGKAGIIFTETIEHKKR